MIRPKVRFICSDICCLKSTIGLHKLRDVLADFVTTKGE